jgi:hypothetical protein
VAIGANRTNGSPGLVRSTAAGVVAAVAGAVVWAAIVEATGYKIGFAAVGLGVLVGGAMALTAGTSSRLPVIGGALALVGCLLGDLFADAWAVGVALHHPTLQVLRRMITDPALTLDIVKAGFDVVDVVFWVLAASAGYRLAAAGVSAASRRVVPLGVATAGPMLTPLQGVSRGVGRSAPPMPPMPPAPSMPPAPGFAVPAAGPSVVPAVPPPAHRAPRAPRAF